MSSTKEQKLADFFKNAENIETTDEDVSKKDNPLVEKNNDYNDSSEKDMELVETFLKAAENIEMTDKDVKHRSVMQHDSVMEYLNINLDFIKAFGEKIFVLAIGKLKLHFFELTL